MTRPGLVMVAAVVVVVAGVCGAEELAWEEQCELPVCGMAEQQAEGLARLRVLKNYITETMTLLKSVVTSLDEELTVVGQELVGVVGGRCQGLGHSALAALTNQGLNVTDSEFEGFEVLVEAEGTATNTLEGIEQSDVTIDSVSGESHHYGKNIATTSKRQQTGSTSSLSSNIEPVLTTSRGRSSSSSTTTSTSTTLSTGTTSRHPGTTSRHPGTTSRHPGTTSLNPGFRQRHQQQTSETRSTVSVSPQWTAGGQQGQWGTSERFIGATGQGGSRGQGRGQSWGRTSGRGQGVGHSGRGRGHGQGVGHGGRGRAQGCRGVPVGSPHWVPNLDAWCVQNCAAGNCPATHCVC